MRVPVQDGSSGRHEYRLTTLQLAAAVVTLLTAVVGALVVVIQAATANNPDRPPAAVTTETQVPVTEPTLSTSSPDESAAPMNAPTTKSADSSRDSIYHAGTITLVPDRVVDLDALPSDPQWGISDHGQGFQDIGWPGSNGDIYAVSMSVGGLLAVDSALSYDKCSNATGYDTSIPGARIRKGLKFCVKTDGGRFAAIQITKWTGPHGPITLKVTTYKDPSQD